MGRGDKAQSRTSCDKHSRSQRRKTSSRLRKRRRKAARSRSKSTSASVRSSATSAKNSGGSQLSETGRSEGHSVSHSDVFSCEESLKPRKAHEPSKGGNKDNARFGILYWGSANEDGWDLDRRGQSPYLCGRCGGLADSWRGRFENAQVTLRVCAEGKGFKPYVQHFLMLSAGTTVQIDLRTFSGWASKERCGALTEQMVLGTILQVHNCRLSPETCGVRVHSGRGRSPTTWHDTLRSCASTMRQEAHQTGGGLAALLLDARGRELRAAEMASACERAMARRGRGARPIHRLLVLLGGPSGIQPGAEVELARVLTGFTDFPLLCCSLPGGLMHSYYALTTLFVLHDQRVLLPFLSELAEDMMASNRYL